jgi:hypothetical protein
MAVFWADVWDRSVTGGDGKIIVDAMDSIKDFEAFTVATD